MHSGAWGEKSIGSSGEGRMIKLCSQQRWLTSYSGLGAMTKTLLIAATLSGGQSMVSIRCLPP